MKMIFPLAVSLLLFSACSAVQFGREFDENGDEVTTNNIPAEPRAETTAQEKQSQPAWQGEDDYYGEEERELTEFNGVLGDVSVSVTPITVKPYANSREQRWSKRTNSLAFWKQPQDYQASDEALAEQAAVKTLFDQQVAAALVQSLAKQLVKELPTGSGQASKQSLHVEITRWGASDDFGLYSSNFRVALTVKASLNSESGEPLWQETMELTIDDPERPSASLDELAEKAVLLAHSEIAAQFMAHDIVSLLNATDSETPRGYDKPVWVDDE